MPMRAFSEARWLRKDSTEKIRPTQRQVRLAIMRPTAARTRATNPATSGSSSSMRLASGLYSIIRSGLRGSADSVAEAVVAAEDIL